MYYARALAFAVLRQALAFPGLPAGDDPWGEAVRQRPLTRSEPWTITKLVEAVMGRVLGLAPRRNLATIQEEARRKIENLTGPGAFIADCYAGGGAFVAAAKATGRGWLATERDEAAALIARKRVAGL
jgi:hypothetical protein